MLVNGILLGGLYCLLGIGMTLIFGVMRIINACHGDLLMVAMYLAFFLFTAIKLDPFVAIFVAMPVLFVIGCAIYSGLIRRLRGEFAGEFANPDLGCRAGSGEPVHGRLQR